MVYGTHRRVAERHKEAHDENAAERTPKNTPDRGSRLDEFRSEVGSGERQRNGQSAEEEHFHTKQTTPLVNFVS